MFKQKIGMSVGYNYGIPTPDVVKMLKQIGFEAISPEWRDGNEFAQLMETARECGLLVESLHAPFWGAAAMWSPEGSVGDPAKAELLKALEDCKAWQIPVLVVHAWIGFDYHFDQATLYYQNIDEIVARAEEYGITVAFENVEGGEFLDALMDRYQGSPTVGFCWDSGHEMCYSPGWDFLTPYGDRLIMTHLNDNLGVTDPNGQLQGTDDLHLLPHDGVADWDSILHRLKQARPQEILNFELKIRPKGDRCKLDLYSQMPLEQYFQEAYRRACDAVGQYFE